MIVLLSVKKSHNVIAELIVRFDYERAQGFHNLHQPSTTIARKWCRLTSVSVINFWIVGNGMFAKIPRVGIRNSVTIDFCVRSDMINLFTDTLKPPWTN